MHNNETFKHSIDISIADDHPMVVRGIQNMLNDYPQFNILHIYNDGREIIVGLKEKEPSVLLLDIHMPYMNGDELLPIIKTTYPAIAVLMLTNVEQPSHVQKMMENGASGYLLKSTDQQTLIDAITQIYNGKQYIDKQLEAPLAEYVANEKKRASIIPSLSRREKEILELIVKGYTNQEISEKLFLGQRTVETYRYNLMAKLGVKNVVNLVKKATEIGLVNL